MTSLQSRLELISPRLINFAAALVVAFAMFAVLYLQHYQDMDPCNLCIFQRIGILAAGIVFLIAAIHNPQGTGRRIYAGLSLVPTLLGGAVAIRHIWIQHLPADQVPACGPDLDYLLDVFPLQEAINMVLRGSGECADEQWRFLFNIPEWALFTFILLAGFAIVQFLHPANQSQHRAAQ